MSIGRRRFLVGASGAAAVAATAIADAPTVIAQPRIHWRRAERQRGHIAQGAPQFLKG